MEDEFDQYMKSEGISKKKISKKSFDEFDAYMQEEKIPIPKGSGEFGVMDAITYPQRKTEEILTGGKGYRQKLIDAGVSDTPIQKPDLQIPESKFLAPPEQADVMMRESSPAEIGEKALQFVFDPLNLIGSKAISKIPGVSKAIDSGKAALRRMAGQATMQRAARAGANVDLSEIDKLGHVMIEKDLNKYMNNPAKMYTKIVGKSEIPKDILIGDKYDYITTSRKDGLVGKIKKEYMDGINKLSRKAGTLNMQTVRRQLLSRLAQHKGIDIEKLKSDFMIAGEGTAQEKAFISTATKLNNDINSMTIRRQIGKAFNKPKLNIAEAQKLKEDIGSFLGKKEFKAVSDNRDIQAEKDLMVDLYRSLKDSIEDMASGHTIDKVDGAQFVKTMNQRMSNLMDIADNIKPSTEKAVGELGPIGKSAVTTLGGIAGVTAAKVAGFDPLTGLAAGTTGGLLIGGGAKKAADYVAGAATRPVVAGMKGLSNIPTQSIMGSLPGAAGVAKTMNEDNNYRKPQSIPQQLSLVKFPRNTEFLKNNKEMVTLKIAQTRPEILEYVNTIYDQPEKMHNVLPLIAAKFPDLFDDDPYDRFDGEVQNPQMRIKARKDIMNDDSLNNTQKFNMINKMNKTGELNDY